MTRDLGTYSRRANAAAATNDVDDDCTANLIIIDTYVVEMQRGLTSVHRLFDKTDLRRN